MLRLRAWHLIALIVLIFGYAEVCRTQDDQRPKTSEPTLARRTTQALETSDPEVVELEEEETEETEDPEEGKDEAVVAVCTCPRYEYATINGGGGTIHYYYATRRPVSACSPEEPTSMASATTFPPCPACVAGECSTP